MHVLRALVGESTCPSVFMRSHVCAREMRAQMDRVSSVILASDSLPYLCMSTSFVKRLGSIMDRVGDA
eukprot:6189757-Pleurochrysis_carterae.AAC.1